MSETFDPGSTGVIITSENDELLNDLSDNSNNDNMDVENNKETNMNNDTINKNNGNEDPKVFVNKYNLCSYNNIYKVIIENKIKSNDKYISLLKVAELVNNNSESVHIASIRKVNRNQIIVSFNNKDSANLLVIKSEVFEKKKL